MALQPSITTLMFVFFMDDSNLRKCLKCLIKLAHPEGFEPPTTWFEASGTFPPFSAPVCRLLYIVVPTDLGVTGS